MKTAKIIAIYFGVRRRFPKNFAQAMELADFVWNKEVSVDPGAPMDTYFVHSRSSDDGERVNEFLDRIDGQKTFAGTCHVLHRENSGLSYGAYNHGFENLRGQYDQFFFTEDDFVTVEPHYLRKCMNSFGPGVGFVAARGIGTKWGQHADGGVGLAKTETLERLRDKFGQLPYYPGVLEDPSKSRIDSGHSKRIITPFLKGGEVAFTNELVKLGYKIVCPGNFVLHCETQGMSI